jgi:4'-phosphopantetheinyl transferase
MALVWRSGEADPSSMWWLARGEEHLPRDRSWLSAGEVAYVDSKRFTKRRTEFLVARWTAKQTLARVLSMPSTPAGLRRIEVRHAASGAPVAVIDGEPVDLQISLTDRAGWAVCVVGTGPGPVGCDLELVELRSDAFVRDYLTAAEQRHVDTAADLEARNLAANLLWSAKESGLKVLTTGLRRDTRSVEVTAAAGSVGRWARLTVRTVEGQEFPGWWRRFGGFILTVAAAEACAAPTALEEPPVLDRAQPTHSWLRQPSR